MVAHYQDKKKNAVTAYQEQKENKEIGTIT